MSEELLLNDRRVSLIQGLYPRSIFSMGAKDLSPAWIRTTDLPIHSHTHQQLGYKSLNFLNSATDFITATRFNSEQSGNHSKMKNKSVRRSLEKSKNILEEKRKNVKQKKFAKKKPTFIIILCTSFKGN